MIKKLTYFPHLLLFVFAIVSVVFFGMEKYSNGNWSRSIGSDGKGYYIYLPAAFIYHDFSYGFDSEIEHTYYEGDVQPALGMLPNGKKINKYFIGESLLLSPFFLSAWVITETALDFEPDGYSDPFNAAVNIGALFYGILGLFFLLKAFKFYHFSESIQVLLITSVFFGTNLLHYTWMEPSMSHVYSFAAISCFIYLIKKQQLNFSKSGILFLFLVFSIIISIRPINGMVIFFIPFLLGGMDAIKSFFKQHFQYFGYIILGVLLFAIAPFLQLYTYWLQTGNWFVWSYGEEGFNFLAPNIFNILFSFRKGWFIYTPFMFLCFVAVLVNLKTNIKNGLRFILPMLFIVYVLSCWHQWYYGGSYGCRALIEYMPFMLIPLGEWLNHLKNGIVKLSAVLFSCCCILLNLVQTHQYRATIIRWDNMTWDNYQRTFLSIGPQYFFCYANENQVEITNDLALNHTSFNDFEKTNIGVDVKSISTEKKYSGNSCLMAYNKVEKSICFDESIGNLIKNFNAPFIVELNLMVFKQSNHTMAQLNVETKNGNEILYSSAQYLNTLALEKNSWQQVTTRIKIPAIEDGNTHFIVFISNRDKEKIYIDDVSIKLFTKVPNK